MDALHLVALRITLRTIISLEIRFPTGNRIHIRKAEGPFVASLTDNGWIVLPSKEERGLPIAEWEDIWGDEKIDIEVQTSTGWRMIESWEELDGTRIISKAAE